MQQVLAAATPGARERVWVGDDVHRLDSEQAERLAAAVQAGRIVPLATAWSRSTLDDSLERLCRDGVVERMELEPASAMVMLRIVEEALGAHLDPRSVPAFVPRRAGGDLVVLRAAALEILASGALGDKDERLLLTEGIPPRDGLRRLVHARLASFTDVTPQVETVLDVLSLAPELSETDLIGVVGGEGIERVVERLEDDHVVEVLDDQDGPRVRVRDAVIELVLPYTIGRLRHRRLTRAIVDVLGAFDPDELGSARITALARYALPLGRPVSPRVLLLASVAAFEHSQVDLALQLAFAADAQGGGFDAQVALAASEWRLGRPSQALERLDAVRDGVQHDADKKSALDTIRQVILSTSDDPAFGWDRPTGSTPDAAGLDPASLREFESTRETIVPDSASEATDAARLREVMEGERLRQAAENAALRGDLRQCHAFLDAAESILNAVHADTFVVRLGRAFADSLDGEMESTLPAITALRDDAAASGHGVHQALATWILGHRLLYSGRAARALTELTAAQELMVRLGMDIGTGLTRAEQAIALAQLGTLDDAEDALRTPGGATGHPFVVGPSEHQARGWIAAASGSSDEAAASFIAGAEAYMALGHVGAGVLAWVEAARSGAAIQVRPCLEAAAVLAQGENAAALIEFARTLAGFELAPNPGTADALRLADELTTVAARLAAAGFHLHSAEAYSRAEALLTRLHDDRAAAEAARHVEEQLAICGVETSPFVVGHVRSLLSDREQEIAGLAVLGNSNREIAEALVLSVRTVETHLQRVYRKLGVRGRAELEQALPGHTSQASGSPEIAID